MLQNSIKITWRSFQKQKLYSLINIAGLALGMACCLLIALWVKEELSYDRFYTRYEDVYAVKYNGKYQDKIYTNEATPGPMAATLKREVPQVAYSTRIGWEQSMLLTAGTKSAKEKGLTATADFFRVFPVQELDGNATNALQAPDQIVITRRLAEKYFGTVNCTGKTLLADTNHAYTIGAVVENLPDASTLSYNWVMPYTTPDPEWMTDWGSNAFRTFVRLKPGSRQAKAEAAMKELYNRYTENTRGKYAILQPLTTMHLYSEFENGKPTGGLIKYVRIFIIIASFILLIACINFMNMTTARATIRSKEIGVRKILGAPRNVLFRQFMAEAFFNCLTALLLAVAIVQLSLPAFNQFLGKNLQLSVISSYTFAGAAALLLITTLLSGSYPALLLSAQQPVHVLKNNIRFGLSAAFFRKALVVLQFTISIFLIAGILVMHRQMKYTREKDLGLNHDQLVYIPLEGRLKKQPETFRQQVLQSPAIAAATVSTEVPAEINISSSGVRWPGMDEKTDLNIYTATVGYDFLKTMGIQLIAGRDFSRPGDTSSFVINEAMAAVLGKKDPLGQTLDFWGNKGPVIGVVKNFHYASLYRTIEPLVLCYYPSDTRYMLFKLKGGHTAEGIAAIEQQAKIFNPQYPFDYHFTDEVYDRLYKSETITGTLVSCASVLAVIISSLGLLALSAFMAAQRVKEIGIRKVLGATVTNIVALLSKDFIILVGIAFVIACPVAWYVMNKWLQAFAYRVQLNWFLFLAAGLIALVIAVITMSFQSVKAATANPAKSLQNK